MADTASHSELPPSSADKWMVCGGWLRANRGLPDKTSDAADEGTIAHGFLRRHLQTGKPFSLSLSNELFEALSSTSEWIRQQPGVVYPEAVVDYGQVFGYVGLTGTLDVAIVDDACLTIGDFKYGIGDVVEVVGNKQLLCYLVGAIQRFGHRPLYKLAIMQPRAYHPLGPIRVWTVTDQELKLFLKELEKSIKANYSKGAYVVGPHCRHFCRALGSCKAVKEQALKWYKENPVRRGNGQGRKDKA